MAVGAIDTSHRENPDASPPGLDPWEIYVSSCAIRTSLLHISTHKNKTKNPIQLMTFEWYTLFRYLHRVLGRATVAAAASWCRAPHDRAALSVAVLRAWGVQGRVRCRGQTGCCEDRTSRSAVLTVGRQTPTRSQAGCSAGGSLRDRAFHRANRIPRLPF